MSKAAHKGTQPSALQTALPAESAQGIAAIVNDEVISRYDLDQRMRLVISSAGVDPTPEQRKQLEQQVLRSLIDEKLKWQEVKHVESQQEHPKEIVDSKDVVDQLTRIGQR